MAQNRAQPRNRPARRDDKSHKTPQGTVALMIGFIILIILLWGMTYLTLLMRGGTF